MAYMQVSMLLQTARTKQALSVCKRGIQSFKTSVSLWSEYMKLQVLIQGKNDKHRISIF